MSGFYFPGEDGQEDRDLDMTDRSDRREVMEYLVDGGHVDGDDDAGWEGEDGENMPAWGDDEPWDDDEDLADDPDPSEKAARQITDFKEHLEELSLRHGEKLTKADQHRLLAESVAGGFVPAATEVAFAALQRERQQAERDAMHEGSPRDRRAARQRLFERVANEGGQNG